MRLYHNPDVTQPGLHYLNNKTMWWGSRGPCHLNFVPSFRGLGNKIPKQENYGASDWEDLQSRWDLITRELEFLRWMEDLFEDVRKEIRPEAPSRIGNMMLCPKLGVGFCRKPSAWTADFPDERNHIYQVSVTGVAITLDSEDITNARRYGSERLSSSGWTIDFVHWKQDVSRMLGAEEVIRSIAQRYWDVTDYIDPNMKETIVQGTAEIVSLELTAGRK